MSGRDQVANVDVFLILRDGRDRLLLGLRAAHVYSGGQWNVVSGKADVGEGRRHGGHPGSTGGDRYPPHLPEDLAPAGVLHYRNPGGQPRVGFGFNVLHQPQRHGPAVNNEPHKCDGIGWYDRDNLPQPLEPHTAGILAIAASAAPFTVAGWPPNTPAVDASGIRGS